MKNALKSNEWRTNSVHQTFKIDIQKGGPNNSEFLQIGSPQKLGPHLEFLEILWLCEKYSSVMENTLKGNEWWLNCVHQTFKIKIQKRGRNN